MDAGADLRYPWGMSKLTYLMNVSLDGFIETPDHSLDWTVVDDELHAWFNERTRESRGVDLRPAHVRPDDRVLAHRSLGPQRHARRCSSTP